MARNSGRTQKSKRARAALKAVRHFGLPGWMYHPSHISWRPNRNGNPIYHPRQPGKRVL